MMEWISVEDRLPDNDGDIVLINGSSKWPAHVAEFINRDNMCGFSLFVNGIVCNSATHWMPLPQPPTNIKDGEV